MENNQPQNGSIIPSNHDARCVSNFLIRLGMKASKPADPLKIIKMTYLSHGWMLGLYNQALSAQPVEAWRYGPVIPDTYHGLKKHGNNPINETIDVPDEEFDKLEADIIEQVWDIYDRYTGIELSQITHADQSPWHITWSQYGKNAIIPNPLIRDHYARLFDE